MKAEATFGAPDSAPVAKRSGQTTSKRTTNSERQVLISDSLWLFGLHQIVDPHVIHEELVGQLGFGDIPSPWESERLLMTIS
jgi:hypothetical protein